MKKVKKTQHNWHGRGNSHDKDGRSTLEEAENQLNVTIIESPGILLKNAGLTIRLRNEQVQAF